MVRLLLAAVLVCSVPSVAGADTICVTRALSKRSLELAFFERDIREFHWLADQGLVTLKDFDELVQKAFLLTRGDAEEAKAEQRRLFSKFSRKGRRLVQPAED